MDQGEISIFPEVTVVYATFWQRFAAAFLDGMVLLIPNLLIGKFIGGDKLFYELMDHHVQLTTIAGQLLQMVISLFYFVFMESGASQATIGKQALGLKVTSTTGEPISVTKALARNAGKWVSDIILLIGYFMMLWDDRNQTLHDKMAGTLVVKKQA
jgi:uncharacterized RDD family membrane protein YckC